MDAEALAYTELEIDDALMKRSSTIRMPSSPCRAKAVSAGALDQKRLQIVDTSAYGSMKRPTLI